MTGLKVTYFASTDLLSRRANSLQIMKMCSALAHWTHHVTLVNFCSIRAKPDSASLSSFYSVATSFNVRNIFSLKQTNALSFLAATLFQLIYTYLYLRKAKPNFVFGRSLPAVWLSSVLGCETAFETHYPVWESRLHRIIFNHLLKSRGLRKIIVITEALKRDYLKRYPELKPSLFLVLPDAADEINTAVLVASPLRGKAGSQGGLNIGYAGSLYHGKGIELILKLASILPNDNFHIFGGEDKEVSRYERWASARAVTNIFFYGFLCQKNLDNFIQSLDICLLPIQNMMLGAPSKSKKTKNLSPYTSPMKLFQYMAHGKAIISSDLPVLREVIDESLAHFATPDDPLAWAAEIEILRDESLRAQLGEKAQSRQKKQFTWKQRARSLLEAVEVF